MLVVLDVDGVLFNFGMDPVHPLVPTRLLTEYLGATFSYAAVSERPEDETCAILARAGFDSLPVLGFAMSAADRARTIEEVGCRPGLFLGSRNSIAPGKGWSHMTYQGQDYHLLVQRMWQAVGPT